MLHYDSRTRKRFWFYLGKYEPLPEEYNAIIHKKQGLYTNDTQSKKNNCAHPYFNIKKGDVSVKNALSDQLNLSIFSISSTILHEKPHSLSYHASTFTRVPATTIVERPYTMDECGSPKKSLETRGSSV